MEKVNFPKDFREFINLLNVHDVEFTIVGGYAVAYHGHPRFTGDLDILILPQSRNIQNLFHALSDFGFASTGFTLEDFLNPNMVMQIGRSPLRIDLITSIDGVSTEQVFQNRLTAKDDDVIYYFINYEDLIKNKRAAGRPKDIADLEYMK